MGRDTARTGQLCRGLCGALTGAKMSNNWDIEIRPEATLTPAERARARDCRVREFDRQWSDWTDIARCCLDVKRDQDYIILGFTTWNAWLVDAAPRSRSYIYLAIGRYEELIHDIPEEELSKIPLGSAGVLRQLSSSVRKNPAVRAAAKGKPRELRKVLATEFKDQHIETVVEINLKFTASQWAIVEAEYEKYLMEDPRLTMEQFFEFCVLEIQEDAGRDH